MPGRQGSGGLGGSGGGGLGGSGGGGGGFGGGGFGGGGFRGGGGWGGWGGGPRWGGGWGGWGGPRWGGSWGWRPRLFGYGIPIFGGGGSGCGCGGIGLVLLVLFGVSSLFGGLFNGGGGYNNSGYNGGYNNGGYNNNAPIGNTFNNSGGNAGNSGSTGLSSQPASIQTQTAIDLSELHGALDSRIPSWESTIGTNQEKHISNVDAGMPNDNNIKDVIYGKCGTDFYVFVIDKRSPNNVNGATGQGYAYTTATSPGTCHPTEYGVTDWENDGGGYWFIYTQ